MKATTPPGIKRRLLCAAALAIGLCTSITAAELPESPAAPPDSLPAERFNVLMIILDDLNDWLGAWGHPVAKTPNLDRLAKRGFAFRQAYCSAPACGPSRTSLLTGLKPSTSGVYTNPQRYRAAKTWVADITNLPQHFKAAGYLTAGYGKVFHHSTQQQDDAGSWSPGHYFGYTHTSDARCRTVVEPHVDLGDVRGKFRRYGPMPDDWDQDDPSRWQQDTANAHRTVELIKTTRDLPFFCALGLWRPHGPFYVPKRYYELYKVEEIPLPPPGYRPDDLSDVPEYGRQLAAQDTHRNIVAKGKWRDLMHAYLAAISYADDQVGRVLDALADSPHRDNTVIIVLSDNGWHTGEKEHWNKFTLWEKACRVPMIVSLPNRLAMKPAAIDTPVSLLDLYPTLVDLCSLPQPSTHNLDGVSLVPILHNPTVSRGRPVLSTYGRGNHTIRSSEYRYIRYRNGDEELYDAIADPFEWKNLAADPGYAAVKRELAGYLPKEEAPLYRSHSWTQAGSLKGSHTPNGSLLLSRLKAQRSCA